MEMKIKKKIERDFFPMGGMVSFFLFNIKDLNITKGIKCKTISKL